MSKEANGNSRLSDLIFKTVILVMFIFNSSKSFGEGTREFLVNNALKYDTTKSIYTGTEPTTAANCVQIYDQGPSAGGVGRISGTYTSIQPGFEKYRIKVRVCNVGEVINFGFHPENNAKMYWRLYKEDGTPIKFDGTGGAITNLSAIAGVQTISPIIAGSGSLGPNDFTYLVPTSATAAQPGYIKWYSQAAVGPLPNCSTTVAAGQLGVNYPVGTYCGYKPIQYIVQAGDIGAKGYADFFIVMNGNDPINEQKTINCHLAMFDVTVTTDNVTNPRVIKKSRLFSAAWDINCNGAASPQNEFNSKLYFYSKDSVVTAVTFNKMRPWGFVISANATGTGASGNVDQDRRSRIQFYGAPDYPIFVNNPYDTLPGGLRTCGIVPKSSFGSITKKSISGCDNDRCINLTVDKTGTVGITLFPTPGGAVFTPRVFPNTTLIANQNVCIPWDGKDGAGNPIVGPVTVQVNYFNGLTHLPLFDVEEHQYGYIIDLVAPGKAGGAKPILVYWNDTPYPGSGLPDITAGNAFDGYYDKPLPLPAKVGVRAGYSNYTNVAPFPTEENQVPPGNPALYAADTIKPAQGTYNLLGCNPLIDHSTTALFQGCHLWTNRGQNIGCPVTGTANCAETMNTWWNANVIEVTIPYFPSNVQAFSDIDAAPAPFGTGTAASRIKNFCSTVNPIPIQGLIRVDTAMVTVADANNLNQTHDINGTGKWSLIPGFASGSLGSAPSNITNTYIPVAADYVRGFVLLKITTDSTKYTKCGSALDTLRINLFKGPDVWARTPGALNVCAGNASVKLDPGIVGDSSGASNVVTSIQWYPYVGGVLQVGGTFVPNNQSLGLTATYTPPAAFTNGTITMRIKSLTTTLPGTVTCPADSDQFTFTVKPLPTITLPVAKTISVCNTGAAVTVPVGTMSTNAPAGSTVQWSGNGTFTGATSVVLGSVPAITYTPTAAEFALGLAKIIFSVTQAAPACNPVKDTLKISLIAKPTASAGATQSFCKNNVTPINLKGVATNFASVSWSFATFPAGGAGSFVPANNDTTVFTLTSAAPDSIKFTMTSVASAIGGCPNATSTVKISFTASPTVVANGGAPVFYCSGVPVAQLNATFGGAAGGVEWWGNKAGTIKPLGTFAPNSKTATAAYTLDPSEVGGIVALYILTTGNGNCKAVADSMLISPVPNPVITVPNMTSCSNVASISLPGPYITGPTAPGSIKWKSLGSAQSFSSTTTQATIFSPTATDINNGSVKLVLSAVSAFNGGTCAAVSDTALITFTAAPTVSAGPNHFVCNNNASVNLSGSVTPTLAVPNTVQWSVAGGGAGTFAPGNALATTFTHTGGAPAPGTTTTVQLTYNFTGCSSVSSTALITYTAPPVVSITTAAGHVCKNNPKIILKGTSSTGALHWTSGSNCATCFTDTNAVFAPDSTTYTPSAADLAANSVTFTVTSRNNGNCSAVSSSAVTFTFDPSPTVSAGTHPDVCENNLNGVIDFGDGTGAAPTFTGATGVAWTSSSGCVACFDNPTLLKPKYTPSINDINNGSVTFTLTTTGNSSNCLSVQATTTVNIKKAPSIIAGPDLTVCTSQNTVALTGASSSNAGSVLWSLKPGTGTGSFTNANSLFTAVYNITAADKASGTVIVVLTAQGTIPACQSVSQERVIQFTDIPTASTGPNRTVCMNDTPVLLDGSGSTGGTWTCAAGCTGSIASPGSLSTTYTPNPAEVNTTKTFTYAIPASGGCPAVSASFTVHFNPAPTINIGGPYVLCGNSSSINVTGSFTNATGLIWTSNGTGSFGSQTTPATTYTPSAADTVGNTPLTLTLKTTGASCTNVSTTTTLTITDPVTVNAGPDQNKCGTVGTVIHLAPTILTGGGASVVWTKIIGGAGALVATGPTTADYTLAAGDAGTTVTFQASYAPLAGSPCVTQTDQVSYTFTQTPTATVLATTPAAFCQTGSLKLDGLITNTNTGVWTCTNCTGVGTFSPDNTYNNLIPQKSVFFSPAPADTAKASLSFMLTTDNVNVCGSVASAVKTVILDKKPKVFAGNDKILCANKNVLTLSTLGAGMTHSAGGFWKAGINKFAGFAPSPLYPAALTYDADTVDVQTGFVTLTLYTNAGNTCPDDSDKVIITFSQSPKANAGLDRTFCKNNAAVNLVGTVTPAAGFTTAWTSQYCTVPTPSSCFTTPTALSTTYNTSTADTTGHTSFMLFLTATDPTGLCAPNQDTVVINLTKPPTVKINSTFNPICADSAFVSLNGTISSGGYTWSSNGTGNFQVNAFQPTVKYPFSAADRAKANLAPPNNVITIYLQSDNGFCKPVKDSVKITLTPTPIVNISTGDSTVICANQATISLNANVINMAGFGISWTSSGSPITAFSPNPGTSTTYTVSPIDIAAQTIILVAHSINPPTSTCKTASDQYKVKITPLPIVKAGTDNTICQTVTAVSLSDASSTFATTRSAWSTNGTGVFGLDTTTVGAGSFYYPSYLLSPAGANDVNKPSIILTLTAYGCDTLSDTKTIFFTPKPTVDAGTDQTVCNEATSVPLTGTSTQSSTVNWRVSGSAVTFATTAAATYSLTAADKAAGFVNLVFTANGNGTCGPVTDTVKIIIRPQPTLSIGPDAAFCSKTNNEELQYNSPLITATNYDPTPGIGLVWTTNGTAANLDQFNPLEPSYLISATDITNGSVNLIASARSAAGCTPVIKAMTINITKAPTLDIGSDINICSGTGNTIQLNSTSTNSSGTPSWYSDHLGFFSNPNITNPSYQPDPSEDISGSTTKITAVISGVGACPAAKDSLFINFQAAPTLADLKDTTICYTTGIPIVYTVSSGVAGDWSSTDVTGTFNPAPPTNTQSIVYTTNTTTSFKIIFTGSAASCFVGQSVDANVTLVPAPKIVTTSTPSPDVCVNNFGAPITLNATINNAGPIQWSTVQGFGTIGSSTSNPANYTVSASDFALDSIMVQLTVQGTNPKCASVGDTVVIHTHQAPTVSTTDLTVCSDQLGKTITLNGSISGSGYTGINWSSGPELTINTPGSISTTATVNSFAGAKAILTATGVHVSCTQPSATANIIEQTAPSFATPGKDIASCSNGNSVDLNQAAINPSAPGGFWKTLGTGVFNPNNIGTTNITYAPSVADTTTSIVMPIANVNLVYFINNAGVCNSGYSDTINVTFNKPYHIKTGNSPITFCAQDNSVNLTSTSTPVGVLPAGSSVNWSIANGVGAYTSPTAAYNTTYNPNPSGIPNQGDVANGGAVLKVKLTLPVAYGCPADSGFVSLILVPEPASIVNAGDTLDVCKDNAFVRLQGLVINADGGVWRTSKYAPGLTPAAVKASGTFSDSLDLEAKYFITSADTAKPSVRLYLYSRGGNALCHQVVDSVNIIFTPLPKPTATAAVKNVCADIDSINLSGSFTPAGVNGVWSSSGDGYFTNLGIFDASPVYVPGPTDISLKKVVFKYTSNNYLDCKAYTAKDSTTIRPKIVADAGANKVVCGNNNTGITLTGALSPTPPAVGLWKPLGVFKTDYDGKFTTVLNSTQANYIPGDTVDPNISAVSFRFIGRDTTTITATTKACKPDSSQMVLKIAPAPTVSIATNQQTVCNDVGGINVNVTAITVATQGFWMSSGTGNFTSPGALSTSYNFSAADLDSTNITISFITTDNTSDGSLCNPAGDAMVITLKPKPVVSAIAAYNCVTPIGVTLDNSFVTQAGNPAVSGVWTTNSIGVAGQFSADQFISNPIPANALTSYFPSASDITRGTVTLTLTSAGAGTCMPVSRSINLNVANTPIADAGSDLFVCSNDSVSLKATPKPNLVRYDWLNIVTAGSTVKTGLEVRDGKITGNVKYQLTVTDDRGCTNKDTVAVNAVVNPVLTQKVEDCYGFYNYVKITGMTNPVSPLGGYQWFYNGSIMNAETSDSVRVTQPGVYQVYYSLGACTDASSNSTLILDLPRILTPDYIGCEKSTVTALVKEIPNSQLSSYSPSLMPFTYSWTDSTKATVVSTTNPATLNTSLHAIDTITYYVTSSFTTNPVNTTCQYLDSVRVISIPVPDPRLIDSIQECQGTLVTLDANKAPSNLPLLAPYNPIIKWYVAGDAAQTSLSSTSTYTTSTSNSYVVLVNVGQCSGDDTSVVSMRSYPTKILPDNVKQCFEQVGSVSLDAGPGSAGSPGLTGVTYLWYSGTGDPALTTSSSRTTVITYPMIRDQADEEIIAYVDITNVYGAKSCPVTDTILVRDVCMPRIFPPTAFHPGDGNAIDGEFTIKGKYYKNFKITVYSRWGEVIFYTEDENQHWDGTYRGELMPVGVYAYIITYEGKDDDTKGPYKKEGRIVLVR